jgi:uncharacterized iron-regulated membrane protein
MKIFIRKLHRWLGLLMALQIIAWMASGLYFSLIPIAEIRGEHLTREAEAPGVEQLGRLADTHTIRPILNEHLSADWSLDQLSVVSISGQALWKAEGEADGQPFARLIAADGEIVPRLTASAAESRAREWLLEPAGDALVEWVEATEPGSEIRGRPLPVWKIGFTLPEAVTLYLHPWTGELLARRTDYWRFFDFMWMLHIMDFDTRDDFNHPLLQLSAFFGLVIALSGVIFWTMTTRLFRRRRSVADP